MKGNNKIFHLQIGEIMITVRNQNREYHTTNIYVLFSIARET